MTERPIFQMTEDVVPEDEYVYEWRGWVLHGVIIENQSGEGWMDGDWLWRLYNPDGTKVSEGDDFDALADLAAELEETR
jgi:hypothetical protein